MARLESTFRIRIEAALLVAQLRAVRGYLTATDPVEQLIELRALEALIEIQQMGDAARRVLGLPSIEPLGRLEVGLARPVALPAIPTERTFGNSRPIVWPSPPMERLH